jgi:hypothetical protein
VSPRILLEQVRNTVPFHLGEGGACTPYLERLREAQRLPAADAPSHVSYFSLCLSAHYATVASFVPTDVDNQIRYKLWHPALPLAEVQAMVEVVDEARHWDVAPATTRLVRAPGGGRPLSGHDGEWLSVAVAAYGATRRRDPDTAAEVARWILEELTREAAVFAELERARDGIGALGAATLIAHNLGDLDRVIEQWNLAPDDPLREAAVKLGHDEVPRPALRREAELFFRAGRLNQRHMATENHRHFALREPRCLRRSVDLLLPIGPFFDDWGARLARHPALEPRDLGEIAGALIGGWERLQASGAVGYARALAGLLEAMPGGYSRLAAELPARAARTIRSGELHALIAVPRKRFEEQWNRLPLK